ncbi:MAG: hypothetical protein GWN56_02680 [Nitrosopumilaceae archaeon]|nr:hypothetical protein [Nitrosopumilaceae archaeon]
MSKRKNWKLIDRIENGKSPIMRKRVRILRPGECKQLIDAIPKPEYKALFRALLFTGMRYIELQRFQKQPSWFDGEFINLPKTSVLKHKRTQLERSVRLNPLGCMAVEHFLQCKTILPSYQSWSANLSCWGYRAKLHGAEKYVNVAKKNRPTEYSCEGLSSKTCRKTYESWLVFYYPNRLTEVLLSQGHDHLTSVKHYLNMPFNEHDRIDMKDFVEGWID